MPVRSTTGTCPKAAISVSEMARLCDLSRGHFNHLVRSGVMPQPQYSLRNRRPFYDREQQEVCLAVKATNTGADGQYVVFYVRRGRAADPPAGRAGRRPTAARPPEPPPAHPAHPELIEGLRSLGMGAVSPGQVEAAVRACYPAGHAGAEEGAVLREVWRYLRRQEGVG
jgi:hypothetical protein